MTRIERGAEVSPGIWEYSIPSLRLGGKSRQPLLDACRDIKRMGGPTGERAGLFREGSNIPDISYSRGGSFADGFGAGQGQRPFRQVPTVSFKSHCRRRRSELICQLRAMLP